MDAITGPTCFANTRASFQRRRVPRYGYSSNLGGVYPGAQRHPSKEAKREGYNYELGYLAQVLGALFVLLPLVGHGNHNLRLRSSIPENSPQNCSDEQPRVRQIYMGDVQRLPPRD